MDSIKEVRVLLQEKERGQIALLLPLEISAGFLPLNGFIPYGKIK